jgi:hypothetical protein
MGCHADLLGRYAGFGVAQRKARRCIEGRVKEGGGKKSRAKRAERAKNKILSTTDYLTMN